MFGLGRGVVVAFDDHAGWGTLRDDDGAERFFHCTQIADGTRTIGIGTTVSFVLAPVGLGTWEATDVRTLFAGGYAGGSSAGAA